MIVDQIIFTVYGIPQPKGSAKAFMPKGVRFPIITSANPKSRPWANSIKLVAQKHRLRNGLWLGPLELKLDFFLAKPKSLPKRKVSWAMKRPDLDKLTRSVKDALTGVIYKDDAQVIDEHTRKEYGDAPGVRVQIGLLGCDPR